VREHRFRIMVLIRVSHKSHWSHEARRAEGRSASSVESLGEGGFYPVAAPIACCN
jgi:hypothetical protein